MSAAPPPSFDRDAFPAGDPAAAPPPPGMAVCEVTGKTVPEDETIVFRGRRVSAEGKRILADRLEAGETMPGELEDASRLARFLASFLDGLIFWGIGLAIGVFAAAVALNGNDIDLLTRVIAVLTLLAVGVQLAYFALLHARNGQTLGKMAAKIRVVDRDGGPITPATAWKRSFIYVGPNLLSTLPGLILGATAGATQVVEGVVQVVVGVFILVNVLLIFRASKRCLHDDLCGTRVVTTRG